MSLSEREDTDCVSGGNISPYGRSSNSQTITSWAIHSTMFFVAGKNICGLVDLVTMELLIWDQSSLGVNVSRTPLTKNGSLWDTAVERRRQLTEALMELDENLADDVLCDRMSVGEVPASRLRASLINATNATTGERGTRCAN